MRDRQRMTLLVSAAVAGGMGAGAFAAIGAATEWPPLLTGVLAALFSALLGAIALAIALRVVGE
jgi:hypothetical protein